MPAPDESPARPAPADPSTWKRGGRALVATAALALAVLLGLFAVSVRDLQTSSSGVQPWFPDGTPERAAYLRYDELFGPEDYWIVTLEGDPAPGELGKLAGLIREAGEASNPPLIRRVRASTDFLAGLPPDLADQVRRDLSGVFFDQRGERGVVLFESTAEGFRNRDEVYRNIIGKVEAQLGDGKTLRIMGPGFVGIMADRETVKTLVRVTPVTFLLSAVLAFLMLGNVRRAAVALTTSGLAALASILAIHLCGESVSHLLVVVPSLAQLVALSNAIHLLHHYDDALEEETDGSAPPAWSRALAHGWLPTVAACLTTMIGFLALLTSSLPVVRSFSVFGAIAVILSMVLVLLFVPAGLALLRPGPVRHGRVKGRLIPAIGAWVARHPGVISVGLGLAFVAAMLGTASLRTESRTESFFSEDSELKQHLRWYEREFGYLQASQLLGRFDPGTPFGKQADAVVRLREALAGIGESVKLMPSQALMAQGAPAFANPGEEAVRALAEEEQIFVHREDGDYWLVTLFHESEADPADSPVKASILGAVADAANTAGEGGSGEWVLTGIYQLFGSSQAILMRELFRSFFLAFAVIAPLVILFLRDLRLGLVATVPNLFPIAVFFGLLGHSPIRVDIATMIVASIAFGIAVDNTIHFLTAFSRGRREPGASVADCVALGFAKCGPAMVKTTLILSVGMLAFLLSDFGPSRRFAAYTSAVLLLALVGDLILLPALLSGVLARFFKPGRD